MPWEAYAQLAPTSCSQSGIALDPETFVQQLQPCLTETIRATDAAFPIQTSWAMQEGEPVRRQLEQQPEPEGFAFIDRLLRDRRPEGRLVDGLTDTEPWRNWTAACGPRSGLASRLVSPQQRDSTTTFCSGCSLGPTPTARSVASVDRRHGA